MATHPANELTWLLEIKKDNLEYLGQIRHWTNLEMASGPVAYWVKGFTEMQLNSTEVRSIPFKRLYFLKDQQLFPQGHLLPTGRLPEELAWMPIAKGLPVSTPTYNHNYFGTREKYVIQLIRADTQHPAIATLIALDILAPFIESAPAIRLAGLSWTIIGNDALIFGNTLLPLPGTAYWQRGNCLLPAGYDLEFPLLSEVLDKEIKAAGAAWLLWKEEPSATAFSCLAIPSGKCMPLSRSSFRASYSPDIADTSISTS